MIDRFSWVGDTVGYDDALDLERGSHWSSTEGDGTFPNVTRPIGFMRSKPRVRVKAWMQPIIEEN